MTGVVTRGRRWVARTLDRGKAALAEARNRSRLVDHVVATQEQYSRTNANTAAAAATYFGYLSFFPILAVAFFAVGEVASVFPHAQDDLETALNEVLPGVIGTGEGQIPFSVFTQNAARVGLVGLVGLVYAGTGWLAGLRDALAVVFELPADERFGWWVGKARDLAMLVVIGLVLVVSVALSGFVSTASGDTLGAWGLDSTVSQVLLRAVGHGLAVLSATGLFLLLFRLLARSGVHPRGLLEGAVLGAVGFEVLKSVAWYLLDSTRSSPAFAALGVSLVLLLWINYFSRILLYGAAWAATSPHRSRTGEASG